MLNRSDYSERLEKTHDLLKVLHEKRWLKTEMDLPYDDFVRWENLGLFLDGVPDEKHGQRKYSYVDYTWAKVVQILRDYGFSTEQILKHRNYLASHTTDEMFKSGMAVGKELIRDILPGFNLDRRSKELEEAKHLLKENVNIFSLFSVYDIIFDGTISMVFHREDDNKLSITSKLIDQYMGDAAWSVGDNNSRGPVLIVRLSDITCRFINNDLTDKEKQVDFLNIISNGERKVLARIRRSMDKLKSITIEFGEDKSPRAIEVEKVKKVALENRLLEVISKGEYSNIKIVTQKGDITYFKKGEKIKVGTEYLGPLVK